MKKLRKEHFFLLIAALGLTPIALSYGILPEKSMSYLFDIDASNVNSSNIFRAVMVLYIGMIILWVQGAFKERFTFPALCSLVVFMFGLSTGRILSLVLDGVAHPLLMTYMFLEGTFGFIGIYLLRRPKK